MEAVCLTDYFAVIAKVGLPAPAIPKPISDEAFHQRMVADLSLLALVLSAAITVAAVILNWSY